MSQEFFESQLFELTEEIAEASGVRFDPERTVLTGSYGDEISAHRAKRLWVETLHNSFLLERDQDFKIYLTANPEIAEFRLTCEFLTACARYAFWRITNNQAPEAQYVIETAHIPVCDSRHDEILRAPDLRSVHDEPAILRGPLQELRPKKKSNISGWLRRLLQRLP